MSTGQIPAGGSGIGQRALLSQGGAADQLQGAGASLFGRASGQLDQSGRYFSTLASGNRAAMTQTLAPQIASTNAVYGGTAKTIGRFLRGPEKDVQLAETERERGGAISGLFSGGRTSANSTLAGMGATGTQQGIGASGSAGSLFGGVAGLSQAALAQSTSNEFTSGQSYGGLLFSLLKTYAAGGAG